MLVKKFADILAIQIVQHGDVAAVAITPPALLAIDKDRVFTRVVLAEPLGRLAAAVNRPRSTLPADAIGIVAGKSRIRQIFIADAACQWLIFHKSFYLFNYRLAL